MNKFKVGDILRYRFHPNRDWVVRVERMVGISVLLTHVSGRFGSGTKPRWLRENNVNQYFDRVPQASLATRLKRFLEEKSRD